MVCTFFCTYILTLCLLTQSIAFIRLVPFLIFWVLKKFNGSPKASVRCSSGVCVRVCVCSSSSGCSRASTEAPQPLLAHSSPFLQAIVRSTFDQFSAYGPWVAPHVLTMMLGLVYCCINPIICPFALTYFAVNTLRLRYNELYVFR